MKKFSVFWSMILFLFLTQCSVNGQTIQPIERSVGKLQISIDPRMELLASIHLLSNNRDLANRDTPYSKDIINYFEDFSTHNAVKLTENLRSFTYDAPVTFMLYLSQPPELAQRIEFSDYLLGRSGRSNNLAQYQEAIKQFAKISDFEKFWNSKISFYNQILDLTIAEIGKKDLVKVLEDYYNETQGSYNIIITPAFTGGKGPKIPGSNGKHDIYACISATNMKNNMGEAVI